jgi:hypothetical protein
MRHSIIHGVKRHISGYVADRKDHRDWIMKGPHPTAAPIPPSASLRDKCPPVLDQGVLGTCVAHGTTEAMAFVDNLPRGLLPTRTGQIGQLQEGFYLTSSQIQEICQWIRDPATQIDNYCGVYALYNLLEKEIIPLTIVKNLGWIRTSEF